MSILRYGNSSDWSALPSALLADDTTLVLRSGTVYYATGAQILNGAQGNKVTALSSSSGVVNIDLSLGNYFTLTLTENVTSFTFSNKPGAGFGGTVMVFITQASGPYTVTLSQFMWAGGTAGVVSTGNGDVDLLALSSPDNWTNAVATLGNAVATP